MVVPSLNDPKDVPTTNQLREGNGARVPGEGSDCLSGHGRHTPRRPHDSTDLGRGISHGQLHAVTEYLTVRDAGVAIDEPLDLDEQGPSHPPGAYVGVLDPIDPHCCSLSNEHDLGIDRVHEVPEDLPR